MPRVILSATLAATLALPALAQTTPADVFPLDEGNRWTFLESSWSFNGQNGGSTSSYIGAVEWRVDGTVEVSGETLPLLRITQSATGASELCAVGTEVDGSVFTFPFYGPEGTGACSAAELTYVDGDDFRPGFSVDIGASGPQDETIGGRDYPDRTVAYGFYDPSCGGLCDGQFRTALGIGVVSFNYIDDFGPGSRGKNWGLRRAEIGGEAFGAPLDPGAGFFPLDDLDAWGVGDTWTYAVGERSTPGGPYVPTGFVIWTVEPAGDARVLRVDRLLGSDTTTLGTCSVSITDASAANAFTESISLGGESCPDDLPYALPSRTPREVFEGGDTVAGVRISSFKAQEAIMIGGQNLAVDAAEGGASTPLSPTAPSIRTQWRLGRGLGVIEFRADDYEVGWASVLEYARVGGVEYGTVPVADEAGPSPSALSLAVGPNPARAAVRLFIGGESAVRVTVLDALGRVMETREATPGTLTLDASRWAVGVYVVRAESADGVATARLTVAR